MVKKFSSPESNNLRSARAFCFSVLSIIFSTSISSSLSLSLDRSFFEGGSHSTQSSGSSVHSQTQSRPFLQKKSSENEYACSSRLYYWKLLRKKKNDSSTSKNDVTKSLKSMQHKYFKLHLLANSVHIILLCFKETRDNYVGMTAQCNPPKVGRFLQTIYLHSGIL